eukprot:8535280-Pyramimonas_sp.AAC.1
MAPKVDKPPITASKLLDQLQRLVAAAAAGKLSGSAPPAKKAQAPPAKKAKAKVSAHSAKKAQATELGDQTDYAAV